MKLTEFEDIDAWQEARKLTEIVYGATNEGQFSKDYGLKDQVQRAPVSIMANIVEGFDSGSDSEFAKFFGLCLPFGYGGRVPSICGDGPGLHHSGAVRRDLRSGRARQEPDSRVYALPEII